MDGESLQYSTSHIPILDVNGRQVDVVNLKEPIWPVPRRRCGVSEKGIYFKGAGIVYTGHYANCVDNALRLVEETGVEYEKYHVINPALFRRFGIFLFPHQPIFTDCEGGCGKKEENLLYMQEIFHFSAIEEIVDVLDVPIEGHSVYAYRQKELTGGYRDTLNLIEYILCENFNTAWDKNVWDDVACFGYVRDLADWFVSDRFEHKLGTIYALLTGIRKSDKYLYELIVRETTGLEQLGDHHIIYIAAKIIEKFAPTSIPCINASFPTKELYTTLWEALYSGKACCHLQSEGDWSHVREVFKRKIPENVSLATRDLLYHKMLVAKTS